MEKLGELEIIDLFKVEVQGKTDSIKDELKNLTIESSNIESTMGTKESIANMAAKENIADIPCCT